MFTSGCWWLCMAHDLACFLRIHFLALRGTRAWIEGLDRRCICKLSVVFFPLNSIVEVLKVLRAPNIGEHWNWFCICALVLWFLVLNPHRRSPYPKLLWCDTR